MLKYLVYHSLLLITLSAAFGQSAQEKDLFVTLKKHDSIFFERGFNRCDLEYLDQAIHPDLIFYHDQSGIQDRNAFFENTRKNICANPDQKPIRKVDENSLEVYPLYKNAVLYGVIQNGIHRFYIREPNKPDRITSQAKFTHLYLLVDGQWLLREVLSYDHQPIKDQSN